MGNCVLCQQQITNPVSMDRLESQMMMWLQETRPDLIRGLQSKSDEIRFNYDAEDVCIITGNKMNVCTYCYTEHIFNWLLSLRLNKAVLEEYLVYFHFDSHKRGYYEKAQRLGIVS